MYWSEQHLVTQDLLRLLPFGRVFSATAFYHFTDFRLGELITEANRNFHLWELTGISQYNGSPVNQIALFYDKTFLWHYNVPPQREEIISQIQRGSRVRFLSRFFLSQTQVELEFSEIRLQSTEEGTYRFVYTDSKEYTYHFRTSSWDTTIHNHGFLLINPQSYANPIREPNTQGRDDEYQAYFNQIQEHGDLVLDDSYWNSVDSTPTLSSGASTPISEYHRSRALDNRHHPCLCGVDVCHCDIYDPGTPPTPPYIFLWKPRKRAYPLEGLHFNRYAG